MAVRVGFIGLGIMGSRMAANLQAHGYQLAVFNRYEGQGGCSAAGRSDVGADPRSHGGRRDVLFTMLSEPDVVASTALGPAGFLNAMAAGRSGNSSTVNPSFARAMATESRAKNVRYLDAPVTGSKDAAARGELVFIVGGDRADLDVCRPLLASIGNRVIHVGGYGLGSSLKIVNNLLAAVAMAVFAEGAALGQALGVPRQTISYAHGGTHACAVRGHEARHDRGGRLRSGVLDALDAQGSASRVHQRLRSRCAHGHRERDQGALQPGHAGGLLRSRHVSHLRIPESPRRP